MLELVGSDTAAAVDDAATTEAPPAREPEAPNGLAPATGPIVAVELAATTDLTTDPIVHLVDARDDDIAAAEVDEPTPAWEPRFDVDDLGGLLDAKSPLLSRAFRAAKSSDDDVSELDDDEVF